jgi:hypothetical protein
MADEEDWGDDAGAGDDGGDWGDDAGAKGDDGGEWSERRKQMSIAEREELLSWLAVQDSR